MMFNFPAFSPPGFRRYPVYPPYIPNRKSNYKKNTSNNKNTFQTKEETPKNSNTSCNNPQVFNIMGITLYFDDLLILCLLFFLYSEGVKDEMLFIALILLLID